MEELISLAIGVTLAVVIIKAIVVYNKQRRRKVKQKEPKEGPSPDETDRTDGKGVE